MLCWIANAAAGVTRTSHCSAPDGSTPGTIASRYGSTTPAITAVTAAALRRSSVPTARASTPATASSAAVPATIRTRVSAETGSIGLPLARSRCSPTGTAMTAATSPATNVTAAITTALAASTRPRRGLAANVVRMSPRRYSAVMNMTPITTAAISPANAPASVCSTGWPVSLLPAGAMSPDPDTVNRPPACANPCTDAGSALSAAPWMSWPAQRPAGQLPCRLTWSKTPVAKAGPPLADAVPSPFEVTVYPGEAANIPACATRGSPASVAVPTRVQCTPSAESYPRIASPARVSRSQRGDAADTFPAIPATSPVKSHCIRTPWLPVTIIAAYADPWRVLAVMMIPALDHGCTPGVMPASGFWPAAMPPWVEYSPVSEVTRTVRLPSEPSGWRTK